MRVSWLVNAEEVRWGLWVRDHDACALADRIRPNCAVRVFLPLGMRLSGQLLIAGDTFFRHEKQSIQAEVVCTALHNGSGPRHSDGPVGRCNKDRIRSASNGVSDKALAEMTSLPSCSEHSVTI